MPRKGTAKRGRSPEPTSDVGQSNNKRSKQVKAPAKKKGTAQSTSKVGTTTEPVATEAISPILLPPPIYTGNFDLYTMDLPCLAEVTPKKGATAASYEALYQTILTYQAKNDKTAQFFLASPTDADGASIFRSTSIVDPMEEYPFHISIRSIKQHLSLSLPPSVALVGPVSDSPGISASTALEDDHCGIQSASGVFKLKRVWTKPTSGRDFVELFAGHLSFNVTYSAMYKRKGHGTGQKNNWAFWAIRGRTGDDGKEVGLRPMLPVSLHANVETHPTHHPLADTAAEAGKAKQQVSSAPKFAGNFNLYSMCELIEEAHLPEKPFPSPEDVYRVIADADPKVAATCSLGAPISSYPDAAGRFKGTEICDPFVNQPYDVIITSTEEAESVSFTEDELWQFPIRDTDLSGPGMTAQLSLSERGHPGVVAASGYIKFVRVWAKKGDEEGELLEVFEVYLELDVNFGISFKLGGSRFTPNPPRESHGVAFWAVRVGGDKDEDEDEDEEGGHGFFEELSDSESD